MSLHDFFNKLAGITKPAIDDGKAELLKHDSFLSLRTLAVVAFAGYLLYLNHLLLTPENLKLVFYLVALLIVCNTLSKCVVAWVNGWITTTQTKAFSQDNQIDANEKAVLDQSGARTDK
jgi:hypothetical protein